MAQSLSSSQTTSRDAKPTQHIEITHPHNVNSKLAFHKVASYHQHYSTYTLQTYHHKEHQYRSWPTQNDWTKQNNLTQSPDKTTCTLFTPDFEEYTSNLDLKINNTALRMATHPKILGLTLDLNSHTAHTFTTSQYKHTRHYK